METSRTLPPGYKLVSSFSMQNNRLLLIMNVVGFFLLALFGWLFTAAALWLRPADAETFLQIRWEGLSAIISIAIVLLILFVTILVHEAFHGLGFIVLAKARPIFAFRGVYAYAAAPGWYIPRDRYLAIGLAPFFLISLIGVCLIALVPPIWIAPLVLACVINASGAVGDLWVAVLLLRQPSNALAHDKGDEINIYAPLPGTQFLE